MSRTCTEQPFDLSTAAHPGPVNASFSHPVRPLPPGPRGPGCVLYPYVLVCYLGSARRPSLPSPHGAVVCAGRQVSDVNDEGAESRPDCPSIERWCGQGKGSSGTGQGLCKCTNLDLCGFSDDTQYADIEKCKIRVSSKVCAKIKTVGKIATEIRLVGENWRPNRERAKVNTYCN